MRLSILTSFFILVSTAACATPAGEEPGSHWLQKAADPRLSPLQRVAYTQLASVHRCDFDQINHWEMIEILSRHEESQEPMDVLYHLGLDVLPGLAEALADDTPTRTTTVGRMGKRVKVWKVNELIALLVLRITDRDFAVGEWPDDVRLRRIGSHPDLVPAFQDSLLDWHRRSGKKSLSERKIEDVRDPVRQNRLAAIRWTGEHKAVGGGQVLVERIDTILAGAEVNSSLDTELAACALALGRLGDRETTEPVRRVCEHLAYWVFNAYGPPEEGGELEVGHPAFDRLFDAYRGYSLLGHKEAALEELHQLQVKYSGLMEPTTRSEFESRLTLARGW